MSAINFHLPLIGFCAFSGVGKTTLLTKLIPILKARGIRVGVIKHAHHKFEIDHQGKDSYELRKAGAEQMLVVSKRRRALIVETPNLASLHLIDILAKLETDQLDLILVEGFKNEAFAKIELHRPRLAHPLLAHKDKNIIAIASDEPLLIDTDLPVLNINQVEQISAFIIERFKL